MMRLLKKKQATLFREALRPDLADDENAEDTAFEESEEVETEELPR